MNKVLIWDWPVRVGHWLMVGGFALAWLTAESENWRLVHALAGGTVGAAAAFRVLWGFLGSRHARFAAFVRGPVAARDYFLALLAGRPQHFAGHNPAGALAILALLVLALLTTLCGWAIYNDLGGDWLEEAHEFLAGSMLAVVVVHLAGVLVGSLVHRENLVRSMLNGCKRASPADAIVSVQPFSAALLLFWVALAAWFLAS